MKRIHPTRPLLVIAQNRAKLFNTTFSIITPHGESVDVDSKTIAVYCERMSSFLAAPHAQHIPEIFSIIKDFCVKYGIVVNRILLDGNLQKHSAMFAYPNFAAIVSDELLSFDMYQRLEWPESQPDSIFVFSSLPPIFNNYFKTGTESCDIREELRSYWNHLYLYGLSAPVMGKRGEDLIASAILEVLLDKHYPDMVNKVPIEPSGSVLYQRWKIAFDGNYGFGFSFTHADESIDAFEVRFNPEYICCISERLKKDFERQKSCGPEENIDLILRYLDTEEPEYLVLPVEPIDRGQRRLVPESPPQKDSPCNVFKYFLG